MKFELDDKQVRQYYAWVKQANALAVEKQKKEFASANFVPPEWEACWAAGHPYGGAIGGNVTFSFTPTSLGTVCKVKDAISGQELDLTDYASW